MPDATGLELIAQKLDAALPSAGRGTIFHCGHATLLVDGDRIKPVLKWLKSEYGFKFLASLHGADYLPKTPRFGVLYELLNMQQRERLTVKVLLEEPADQENLPAVESVVELFATAGFQEREVFDMFGIAFVGHPDLRRILMPEAYEGWPQRRDFPTGGEPVEFSFNEGRYENSG